MSALERALPARALPPTHFAGLTSHSLIVLSQLAEARVLPSGLYATKDTGFSCPRRVACSLRVATSQSVIVLPWFPAASVLPSGLKATDLTQSAFPMRVASSLPVATS